MIIQNSMHAALTPNAILSFALVSKKFSDQNVHSTALLFTSFEFCICIEHKNNSKLFLGVVDTFRACTMTYWEGNRNSFNRFLTHKTDNFRIREFPCCKSLYFVFIESSSIASHQLLPCNVTLLRYYCDNC